MRRSCFLSDLRSCSSDELQRVDRRNLVTIIVFGLVVLWTTVGGLGGLGGGCRVVEYREVERGAEFGVSIRGGARVDYLGCAGGVFSAGSLDAWSIQFAVGARDLRLFDSERRDRAAESDVREFWQQREGKSHE